MPRFVDPFFPNRPVDDPKKFQGRVDQIDQVIDSLYQIKNSNPKHTIITGDRGIGKSSLLLQMKLIAEGNNSLPNEFNLELGVDAFNFIVAWHDADFGQTPEDISIGLLGEVEGIFKRLFSRLKIEISIPNLISISEKERRKSLSDFVNEFTRQLSNLSKKADEAGTDGILLFIDELDRVSPEAGIGSFFKLVTEKLNRNGINNVAFICAGITGAIQNLEEDHASITRVFRDIPIPRLSQDETKAIIESGFHNISRKYDEEIIVQTHKLSAGYPEPVHLLGSAMLSVDQDLHIDKNDFEAARNKIVRDVRRNKLSNILQTAGHGKYQLILGAMAKYEGVDVPNEHISDVIGYSPNQYSTNMATLVERGIISRTARGYYAFVEPLLKEYIKMFGIIQPDNDDSDGN